MTDWRVDPAVVEARKEIILRSAVFASTPPSDLYADLDRLCDAVAKACVAAERERMAAPPVMIMRLTPQAMRPTRTVGRLEP